jgi:putative transposase
MRRGFVYLAAVVDVATRRVLAHRVSITMEATFCVEALEEALARHGDRRHVTAVQRDGCSFS